MTPGGRDPDRGLSEELRSLPALPAPATLLPKVMAAVRARHAQPWWRRRWWTWPLGARLAYGALLALPVAATLVLGVRALGGLEAAFAGLAGGALSAWWRPVAALARALATVADAAKVPLLCVAFLSCFSSVTGACALYGVWSLGLPSRKPPRRSI